MSEIAETRAVGEKSQGIGEHVVVKSIDIVFNEGIEPSKQLDVFVTDKKKSAERPKANLPERTHRWSFRNGLFVFPNDKLSIRPLHSRRKPKHFTFLQRDHIDSYNILAEDIISFCTDPGRPSSSSSDELDYTGAPPGTYSKITLKVILREFSATLVEVDTTSLNPDAKAEVLESISSSKSLQEAVSQLRSVLSVVGANVEVIQNLENVVKTFASVQPIAQVAVSALLIPYKLLKAEHEFKKDIRSLADEMRFLLTLLEDERWIAKLSSTKDAVMEIMKGVIDTSLFINDFVNKGRFKQFSAAQTRSKLDEHVKCLEKLRGNFETALNLQNAGLIVKIKGVVGGIAGDDNEERAKEFLKEKLEPATQQPLGDLCLQGTRTTILNDVEKWLKDSSRPNVLWISGAPGAGKSTISATVINKILKFKCAWFFVKRGATPELRDPRRIWRSIALDLGKLHRGVRDDITNALREKEAQYPNHADVRDQFSDLLESSIRKHAESFPADHPCVVILDALDECRTNDDDWRALLGTLTEWKKLPSNVKLIVTSRNEKDIRDRLQAVSECIVLETGDDTSEDTSNDIQLFFRTKFQEMGVADKSWPGEDTIIRLTKQAAGLFIWAKTVVKFVGQKNGNPHRRLKTICNNIIRGSTDVDGLYGQVLYETLSDMEDEERDVARFVLAAVSFGKEPFSIQDVVDLLAAEGGEQWDEADSAVTLAVEAFSPIINVRDELLSVCHKTLSDFLTDEARIREVITQVLEHAQEPANEKNLLRYTMGRSEQTGRLAEACLRLMNKKLKFNICHIPTSHCLNEDIPNRDALVKEYIPRILFYACQYWAEHLDAVDESASQTQDAVLPALKDFQLTHILHWLEVLSLTGSMGCVPFSLSCAERFTKVWDDNDAVSELARDAKEFVATFYDVISVSAPHIYLSALPFAPAESKVAQVYGPRHPNTLSVLTGRLPGRSEMLPVAEMRGHSYDITCLAYSPDGKRIASGSKDSTIRIWDAHSGRAIAGAVWEHSDVVRALSPSPNGDKLASLCDDGTFRVWDINENRCTSNLKVVPDSFRAFELSPDWENCAAAKYDEPFKVLGTKDGQLKGSTKIRAEGYGNVVKFSPDGSSLICASGGSIIIRNTRNWETDGIPVVAESGVRCLAVSADGKMFATGDYSGPVRLYDCQERRPLGNPMQHKDVLYIEFSADGSMLVSGSSDGTLCFWDTKTQNHIGGPHRIGPTRSIRALSFSPDGSRLAVAVYDTIQVFDVESCLGVLDDDRPSDVMRTTCIAFDYHRQRFVTGTYGGVVRVWDVHSLSVLGEWVDDDPREITSLAFVRDSDVIAFSSDSGHVRKWNWKTQQLCQDVVIDDLQLPNIVSPDGRHIAFAAEGEAGYILLWNYDTDCEVRRFVTYDDPPIFAFSPDGELIAIKTSSRKIEVWRVAFAADNDGRPTYLIELRFRDKLEQIVFSPDAKQLAFIAFDAYANEEAMLYVRDFEARLEPNLLEESAYAWDTTLLSFSPLGNIIVALASSRNGSQLWDVSTGESIGKVTMHGDPAHVKAAELLNDGTLISVGFDGAFKVWDVGPDEGLRPRLLQSVNVLDSSNTAKVSFVEEFSSVPPWRVVRENRDKSASPDSTSILYPAFFDSMGEPVICDWSYVDSMHEGWMRNMQCNGERSYYDDPILFWLPPANRANFWWPRITAIANPEINEPVTRIDFSRFVHGENWHLCG